MYYRLRPFLFCTLITLAVSFLNAGWSGRVVGQASSQQQNISVSSNEGAAMKSLRMLLAAETTFQNTLGKGEYGQLKDLVDANLINKEFASGDKDGYRFTIVTKKSSMSTPPAVDLIARPTEYDKTGRRSFYLTESGVLMTADEKDAPLTSMRPFAIGGASAATTEATRVENEPDTDPDEDAIAATVDANEIAIIATLGNILTAEGKYLPKEGRGAYGTLAQLEKAGLISKAQSGSTQSGYLIEITITEGKPEIPAAFRISAVPQNYGGTGRRSFFADQTGMLRGGEKEGGPADASDPVIKN